MRKSIIAGNWKMNKTIGEAEKLVALLKEEIRQNNNMDVVVCPPFTALNSVYQILKQTNIAVGAQNVYFQDSGAYTGEISMLMLIEAGCQYVIVGHSERRVILKETDADENKKIKAVLKGGLIPILCVGESLEEREKDQTFFIIENQIKTCLSGLTSKEMEKIILAYEPIWAIGTGKTATPEQANEVHTFIRAKLKELFGEQTAQSTRIQYGGSVNENNIEVLMSKSDIDGALIGGASLDASVFANIIKKTLNIKKE